MSGTADDPWSVPETELIRSVRDRVRSGEQAVLATIIAVEGSAYRRPGAKMAIFPNAESVGSVTAGCLEGPVVDIATEVHEDGRTRVEQFDLMDDDEWGFGLGCNGIIDVLLERIDEATVEAFEPLDNRETVVRLVTVDSTDPAIDVGAKLTTDATGTPNTVDGASGTLPEELTSSLEPGIAELVANGQSALIEVQTENGTVSIFVDVLEPAPRLLLFGNQNDVHPVARLGREAGFEVVVASARGARASEADFPSAHAVVGTKPTEIAGHVDSETYVVLMSHNLLEDTLALETLLADSAAPYVGLMGPRKRFEKIQSDLAEEGTSLSANQIDRVSTPVGLDLGGDEPVEIALSIVSEVVAVSNGRSGGRLKDREGPIHDRSSPRID